MLVISSLRPAASRMLPSGARMMPVFSMSGAIRAMLPPGPAVIEPALLMRPAEAPSANFSLPARKSASLMFRVDATKLLVSMRAALPMMMPLGLIRKTWPLAFSWPNSCEMSGPTTRFRTALAADGCTNCVVWPTPIENFCQLMMAPLEA